MKPRRGLYCYEYPRPMVTVDAALLTPPPEGRKILLIRRKHPPFQGRWALPGGFIDMEEDLPASALRELAEETGIRNVSLRQFRAYGAPGRDPRGRVITIVFYGETPAVPVQGGDDAAEARWFPVERLPALAFDHGRIIHDLLAHLGIAG